MAADGSYFEGKSEEDIERDVRAFFDELNLPEDENGCMRIEDLHAALGIEESLDYCLKTKAARHN